MDGLRPERDELDRFQSRSAPSKSKKAKPKAETVSKSEAGGPKNAAPLFVGSFALTLVLFGFLGWAYMTQSQALSRVEQDLAEAMDFVNQSKLSMARLEGELNEAGAELEESGSAAAEKLKFLDSEMRKLWGVAGDKNRKAISQNKDALAGLGSRFSQLKEKDLTPMQSQLAVQTKEIAKLQSQVAESIALAQQMPALKKQVANGQSELALTREAIEESVDDLATRISELSDRLGRIAKSDAGKQAVENAKAIASIDASRRQINERIVGLDRRLNELKLEVSAGSAP
ncbi:hypothetical protein A3742_05825 [Oleiphilus sp. HI0071]|nr:hypothetical protein [Oleiphilus sp. HI0080]KZY60116.1 hypothetical protein A3737_06785 [Oleiphilus sp. HI0065]KZY84322.1 hypothetical protein A3742_05825 [Oleiphilus sp. HI0071]KZZ02423.1 hypothetical protein A3744_11335 [Oleiphilus sp. HI0073]KZZ44824.1 hypothetical protein A3758_02405 [Oleiphilus sp. HI0118]KZZ50300.1 hypothetical protein A3760_02070 [Oleiphilus sp. HI0122]KZZ71851.1 hypothetical protein A3765_13700 [Oleiphilus sp. HI0130]KZZ78901.1 hypothetical protein A3767_01600 [Ol